MKPILEIKNAIKKFPLKRDGIFSKKKYFTAVNDISLFLNKKETLAIVGESGSGKTTLAKIILGLEKPDSGKIFFHGKDLNGLSSGELRKTKRKIQVVFQDPYSSLNPRMKVKDIILEPLRIHKIPKEEQLKTLNFLLKKMGLSKNALNKYPHEFSGGQRQRIAIARALSLNPEIIIADEPISSLDISIQAQILNLMSELKNELDLSYVFISHDLAVVYHIADKVAVMNKGNMVELAETKELFENPAHPYTKLLLNAIPKPDPEKKSPYLETETNPENVSLTCAFSKYCPDYDSEICVKQNDLSEISAGHFVKCLKAAGLFKNN